MPLVDRPHRAASRRPRGQRPAVARRTTTRPPRQRALTGGVPACVGVDVTEGTPACARATSKHPDGRTGTLAGYNAHRYAGEVACRSCVAVHTARCADYNQSLSPDASERIKEGKRASNRRLRAERPSAACGAVAGTLDGVRAHVAAGQYSCKPCREAVASGVACVFPTIYYPEGRTGTSAGYQAHRDNGQDACGACLEAFSDKSITRRRALSGEDLARYRAGNLASTRRRTERDPEGIRAQKRRCMERKRAAIREAKDRPCADCGVRYPYYVMEFDHVNPGAKCFNVSSGYMSFSVTRVLAEIAKCEVVCANCHAERTHRRRSARRVEPIGSGAG